MQHAISLGTAVIPRRYGALWEMCKWRIRDLPSAGKLFEMRVTLNSKPSMKFSSQLARFSFCGKMLRVFFSLFQRQLFLWNALFSYIVYMLSLLLLHGGVIRHFFVLFCFFFLFFNFILKTCRRKEMAPLFHFTCKHSAPQSSIWNIFYLFQNWNKQVSRTADSRDYSMYSY